MKIPKQAKRVYKGEIFEAYQWPQKMFDGSTETFEMIKRPDTVQIIPTIADKILMAKEEQPTQKRTFSFLGGRVDEGEDAMTAAKRELLEETGMVAKKWTLLKTEMPVTKMDWTVYYFIANDCVKITEPNLDPGEKIKTFKVSFEKMVEQIAKLNSWNNKFTCDILRMQIKGKTELAKFKKKIFSTKNRA